ncbi:heavy metal-responsive transcriptional regulator (plasmid) [Arthrobacter sp. TES]|jgi:DNA-binding transcriptional MerR regulator|nr:MULTISPECIES: heavy metal-responsive transcriptional regulator [Micrococcaceae]QOI65906.1 heavy metal-responsive transcriptional regulator [Arthrobacter sp. TES]MCY0975515.1 heavy metal-responsive transcriptional regulator [Paenarthrobacter ureafaciens]UOD83529.1 heavy metal-responsive transcriptional regulator [Paenarthrobacter ureafaciens]WOC63339.1 heavy metal-responsive transcriptional regulator [Paenarthrobacter sp. AT5]SDQ03780.1 DNA-binding transcriptional regulator, MerR family [Art
MRIGEAAAAVGMTTKTIRFYENRGLLPPAERSANGYREYGRDTISRLEFIRRSQIAGLTLAQIQGILQIRDNGITPCTHVRDVLGKQLIDLDRKIAELTALRATVAEQYAFVEAADPRNCDAEQICSYI